MLSSLVAATFVSWWCWVLCEWLLSWNVFLLFHTLPVFLLGAGMWYRVGGTAQCSSENSISVLMELTVSLPCSQIRLVFFLLCGVVQFWKWLCGCVSSELFTEVFIKCCLGRKGNFSYISGCCVLKECIKQKYLYTLPRFTTPVVL